MKFKKGDRVRMSEACKAAMCARIGLANSEAYVREFGECVGIVGDPMFPSGEGPEIDVYWQPSNRRFGYDPGELVPVGFLIETTTPPRRRRTTYERVAAIWRGLRGGNSDPNRCECTEQETGQNADTPHRHYDKPPFGCARCRCPAYKPAIPEDDQ
jgi:hypothetical protein